MQDTIYPAVAENHTCTHWEPDESEGLALMNECWYCRYSDFRKDLSAHNTCSVCRCPSNQSNQVDYHEKIIRYSK